MNINEELGNPFKEDNQDLLALDAKEIPDVSVVETVHTVKQISHGQFDAFTRVSHTQNQANK